MLLCTANVIVNSHILVGRQVDFYSRGNKDTPMLQQEKNKIRDQQGKGEREKNAARRLRKVLTWIIADVLKSCEEQ